jgi:hypothetical protein
MPLLPTQGREIAKTGRNLNQKFERILQQRSGNNYTYPYVATWCLGRIRENTKPLQIIDYNF